MHFANAVQLAGEQANAQSRSPWAGLRRRAQVFEGATYTFEDDRFAYHERRFVSLGLLAGIPVSIVHTETRHEIQIISFRKATRREAEILFRSLQN